MSEATQGYTVFYTDIRIVPILPEQKTVAIIRKFGRKLTKRVSPDELYHFFNYFFLLPC